MGRNPILNPTIKRHIQVNEYDWKFMKKFRNGNEPMYEAHSRLIHYFEQEKSEIIEQFEQAKRTIAIYLEKQNNISGYNS